MSKVLVIGDSCLDRFVYCRCERLCPEAPVPVLDIIETQESLGMAGNSYRNVISLIPKDDCCLITNPGNEHVTKTRYVEKKTNHMFCRIDSHSKIPHITAEVFEKLLRDLENFSAVIISDYNKGFLNEEDIHRIGENHPLVFLDTKKTLGKWAESMTFIKVNRTEYHNSLPFINEKLKDKIIQTLGENGCQYLGNIWSVKKVEVKNLSGAGDAFLAALVVRYIETGCMSEAIKFANDAATSVVQRIGMATVGEL
jgi:D-beta-D-heptose 7-phosphate kinase/D-beta-D-heptose 1-phosphate adenosyltransferase